MAFFHDLFTLLSTIILVIYDNAPWLVWIAGSCVATCLFLYACALVGAAWRLCTSADERAWFRFLRQARREHRRQEWAQARAAWRTDFWHKGDAGAVLGLLALAAAVMWLCS